MSSVSHDAINRYLRGEQITPRLVWENVRGQVVRTPCGYVLFDDTVLDKNYSFAIELVRHQYSGNAKQVIKGDWGRDLCLRQPGSRPVLAD